MEYRRFWSLLKVELISVYNQMNVASSHTELSEVQYLEIEFKRQAIKRILDKMAEIENQEVQS